MSLSVIDAAIQRSWPSTTMSSPDPTQSQQYSYATFGGDWELQRERRDTLLHAMETRATLTYVQSATRSPFATAASDYASVMMGNDTTFGRTSPLPARSGLVKRNQRRRLTIDTKAAAASYITPSRTPRSAALTFTSRPRSLPSSRKVASNLAFQQHRERLWKHGSQHFGNSSGADALVVPRQAKRPHCNTPLTPYPGDDTPFLMPEKDGRVTVRAVIRSKGRSPVGLARRFDFDALRSTIPDVPASPRTPNTDSGMPLAALVSRMNLHSFPSPCFTGRRTSLNAVSEGSEIPSARPASATPVSAGLERFPALPIRKLPESATLTPLGILQ